MTDPVYAVDPPSVRLAVPLDALIAVYHRPSGATHLLAAPSPELLDALADGPADAASLRDRLAAHYDLNGEDDAVGAIAARMEELVAAGLAWRA
ncbi:HPr-rel-A system PqqD family peptide chaperone [uncultured Sphingomonas sp.]|uniref:HPr-rel-A system PqqD family peptide chaperone n=1 Tax=uncultured Sphingomonas sp. TaxID=158754 RepID=UPI0026336B58|nr:HPr-rel-A system PqqD family peptide chaperone [uncultured Sphingomonas sp.]